MPIEQALADLTAALDRNTAALLAGNTSTPAATTEPAKPARGRPSKAATEPAAAAPAPAAATAPAPAPAPAAAATPNVIPKDVQDAVRAGCLAPGGRDKVLAWVKEKGADNVAMLKPAEYPALVDFCKSLTDPPPAANPAAGLL